MSKEGYVAYVGTYTTGSSEGIYIYDLNESTGHMSKRAVMSVSNPSDVIVAHNGRFLYSITDIGVAAFSIGEDGGLTLINEMPTGGMRGCYLCLDEQDRYLFVAGYYDGRVSMLRLEENGAISQATCGIYHKGMGIDLTERGTQPHVTCVKVTPDDKYLCAVDSGLNHIKIYEIDYAAGKLKLHNVLRFQLDAAPSRMAFLRSENLAFVICEKKECVNSYRYRMEEGAFDLIAQTSTKYKKRTEESVPCAVEVSEDGKHLFVANAGSGTMLIFDIDRKTGELSEVVHTKVSADYPKNIAIMPDGRHFISLGHGTNEIRFFEVNYEKKYFLESEAPVLVDMPNSIFIARKGEVSKSRNKKSSKENRKPEASPGREQGAEG